jgi:uncharacterized FAD-dependent dehydrogenase
VIGAGPCGLFAGLILAEMGFKPIILDRGKVVRQRTKDTWGLWRSSKLDPESNVQFGEGGAGTFSDGKLYSQIKDPRFLARKVLTEFVAAGAPEEILTEAHPHIGTFRLVTMVEAMREKIERLGGEYRFEHRVTDIDLDKGALRGVRLHTGETLEADHVVFAIGHSSRDTFQTLYERGVHIEAKPFSIGFRIEHPQSWIDKAMFGPCAGHPDLGAAAYTLSHHCSNGRTVYSFCMCPGGTVVAATSEPDRVVTNGMSATPTPASWSASRPRIIRATIRWRASNCNGIWRPAPMRPAAATISRRASWSATSWRAAPRPRWARSSPAISRACARPTWRP